MLASLALMRGQDLTLDAARRLVEATDAMYRLLLEALPQVVALERAKNLAQALDTAKTDELVATAREMLERVLGGRTLRHVAYDCARAWLLSTGDDVPEALDCSPRQCSSGSACDYHREVHALEAAAAEAP